MITCSDNLGEGEGEGEGEGAGVKESLIRTVTQALGERCELRDFVSPENISGIVWVDNLVKDWLLLAAFICRRPVITIACSPN